VRRRTFIGLLGGAAAAAPFAARTQELDRIPRSGPPPLNSAVDERKRLVGDAFQVDRAPTRGRDRPLILSDRQGFNRRWYASKLEAVYVPTEPDDVARCVGAALSAYGRDVKVTSGRHCYENLVYNDGVRAVIDMSALNQVGFDPTRRAYFIDAGCENWTVYRTLLNSFGKTLPAGSCGSLGAGGHITGGGYGLLSRMHGLTVDHLTGVDIVTWDAASRQAQLRHVSEASSDSAERDLFWALRGAGCGNFGVIVRYYFAELPDAPDYVTLWTQAWNWNDLDEASFAALLAE
jgi:FAD/FMN-containing dehydrogenase